MSFWFWSDTGGRNFGGPVSTKTREGALSDYGRISPVFSKRKRLEKWAERESEWALFENGPAGEAYISLCGPGDGNYKGSGQYPFTYVGGYKTREEAQRALEETLSSFLED